MKRVLLVAVIAVTAMAMVPWPSSGAPSAVAAGETCTPSRPHTSGTSVESIASGGVARSYRLHVPASYTGITPVAVVFSFHGLGSNALEQEVYSAFSAKSDSTGFIAVFPDGLPGGSGQRHWNAWQLASPEPDDVAFTGAIIDALVSSLCIDQSRVYTSGISNGAMMSVRLTCSLSSRIAAAAPVAGAYYPPMSLNINASETCPDATARPLIAFHGTADATVPFSGGGAVGYRLPIDDATPADDVLSSWATYDGCTGGRQESQVATEVRLVEYGACAAGTLVKLYAVDGGGHTWPGAFDVPSLGYTTHQINATDLIWSFFSNYTLPDADLDLIPDAGDNCPADANFAQSNIDRNVVEMAPLAFDDITRAVSDDIGDACDADNDNDGLSNASESPGPPCAAASGATDPVVADTDGDLYTDFAECTLGSDPVSLVSVPAAIVEPDLDADGVPDAQDPDDGDSDSDGDGIADRLEFRHYGTSLSSANTDADRCDDAGEIASINADEKVSSIDLSQVAQKFGVYALPAPPHLSNLDMNKDGRISSIDLSFVAQRFGSCAS